MSVKRAWVYYLLVVLMLSADWVWAQDPPQTTVGLLLKRSGSFEGYTLFSPDISTYAYLVDHAGCLVNRWKGSSFPGMMTYLLEDGHLLRASRLGTAFVSGGAGGRIEEFDWDGTLLWQFDYSNAQHRQHHDTIQLPNGNRVILAWELRTMAEAIAAGRNPALVGAGGLWPDHLVEVEPDGLTGGTIVWEWHSWDHLIQDFDPLKENYGVVSDHPELVDLNFSQSRSGDLLHCNGISYNPERDEIVISVHRFSEIWVIDHSTTTGEAAGHTGGRRGKGGDLLYRWGNPRAYGAGTEGDRQLWSQHNANWISPGLPGEGNILVFNNGLGRPGGNASSVVEIAPPVDGNGNYELLAGSAFGPAAPRLVYEASPPTDFYASFISSAQRQPNGNTLICDGPKGRFFEVTEAWEKVWEYLNPVGSSGPVPQGGFVARNTTFRAYRYAPDYPGLAGRALTPQGPVELAPSYVFKLEDLRRRGVGLVLRWASQPDVTYLVEHAVRPGGEWLGIGTVKAIGTSTTFVDEESARVTEETGLYRVSLF